jgi:hypothetical protein
MVLNGSIVDASEDGFRAAAHQHTLAAGPAPPLPPPTPGVQEATNITAALQPRWQAANDAALLAADPTYTGVD